MLRSLWSGVSGLKTHQLEMDVIGNNIANVNTTSFKSQSTGFKDILYQTVRDGYVAGQNLGSTNVSQVGLGARMGSIYTNIATQGSAINTDNVFDLMITGDSFFLIGDKSQGGTVNTDLNTRTYEVQRVTNGYSRDGGFELDSWGYLVTKNNGYYVLGARGDDAIPETSADTKPIQVMKVVEVFENGEWVKRVEDSVEGTATTEAYLKGNINRDDDLLEDGRNILLEVFGEDGNPYTLKFKVTDNADDEDNTYALSIESILDKDGNKVKNAFADEYVELIYSKHDGTLKSVVPKTSCTIEQTGTEYDEDGNAVGAYIDLTGKITAPSTQTIDVTGTDKEQYRLTVSIAESEDILEDYTFSLDKIETLSGDKKGTSEEFEGVSVSLKYDDVSGEILLVDGAIASEFIINVDETNFNLGNLNFDLEDSRKVIDTDTGYVFSFGGDASGRLGPYLYVDLEHLNNYANTFGGTSSNIFAYKGNEDGENKGYASGELTGISFGDDGSIYGTYSNGQTIKKGQIAVSVFSNATGLQKIGDNLYYETPNSGNARVQDVTKDGGYINSGVLEGSNVELAKEFTEMITTQRGFQANSKVITTSDEMLQILKGLKR